MVVFYSQVKKGDCFAPSINSFWAPVETQRSMQDYFPLILMFVVTGFLVGVILFLASLLGPKKPSQDEEFSF